MNGPSNSNAEYARFAQTELDWSASFERGQYGDPAIPTGTGERVATRIPDAIIADLSIAGIGPQDTPKVTQTHARGPVVITDRRVVVATNKGQISWQFWWTPQVQTVLIDFHGAGAFVVPKPEAMNQGALMWGVMTPAMLTEKGPDHATSWVNVFMWQRISAAWHLFAYGNLNQWRTEQPR